MLVSFRLNNFKSFANDALLVLTAHRSEKTYAGALICRSDGPEGEACFVPATAIYGANASGKTNFLLAINYMRDAILRSQANWKPDTGTRIHPNLSQKSSVAEFECVLLIDGVRYRYGFRANPERFINEWLFSYPLGRERMLFDRTVEDLHEEQSSSVIFGNHLSGDKRDHGSSLRRCRENSLLISSMAQDNQEEARVIYDYFNKSYSVFKVNSFNSDCKLTSNFAARYKFFNSMLISLLQTADSGISDFELLSSDGEVVSTIDHEKYGVEDTFTPVFYTVLDGNRTAIPFENQSQGLKRLYEISIHVIMSLAVGKLIIIDEIETSLHPHLVAKIVAMFQNPSINTKGAQLIFSTHDTHLLNAQHLRRDQIWFVEKVDSYSHLYSLLEYSPRKGENLEFGYLRGRYGAVPTGGMSTSLFTENAANKEEVISATRGME